MIASIRGKKPHVYRVIILKQMADHKRQPGRQKSNGFITQNNNFARASRFFVLFFTVLARLRRENA